MKVFFLINLVLITVLNLACTSHSFVESVVPIASNTPIGMPTAVPLVFDFSNFTYPATEGWTSFKLTAGVSVPIGKANGKNTNMAYSLLSQAEANVGKSTFALVIINVQTGGSALIDLVYVFDVTQAKPELIWSFTPGDRADGGLRAAYFENDTFVLDTFENAESKGDCCPTTYQSKVFALEGKKARLIRQTENIPNPSGSASFLLKN